jgi:hypothetical protein
VSCVLFVDSLHTPPHSPTLPPHSLHSSDEEDDDEEEGDAIATSGSETYVNYIKSLPLNAAPEVFNMHPNASITKEKQGALLLLFHHGVVLLKEFNIFHVHLD